MLNLFKHKKSTRDIIQEQYRKSFDEITEHYNGVRVNLTLLGKVRSAKMDEITESSNINIKVQSSIPRPKDFGTDVFAWLDDVKKQAKEIMNRNKQYAQEEKEYQEQLKTKMQEQALKKRHEFFVEYGVLAK
jgi:gas vesicle protein